MKTCNKYCLLFITSFWIVSVGVSQDTTKTMAEQIKNEDYTTAIKRLSAAILTHDRASVVMELKHPLLSVRIEAVNAINATDDQNAVAALIEAWYDNQGYVNGGTQVKYMQKELNAKLAIALEKLTGQSVNQESALSNERIREIVQGSNKWMVQRKSALH